MSNKQYINLSHNDIDGAGCNIVLRSRYPDMQTIHTSYNDVAENISLLDDSICYLNKALFITDLNFDKPAFIQLVRLATNHPELQIIYIDHHPYDGELGELLEKVRRVSNIHVYHSLEHSATKLTYQFIKSEDEDLGILVDYINAYDIWLDKTDTKNFKVGWFLNSIFWEIKMSGFKSNLINNKYKIPQFFKTMYVDLVKDKNEYIAKLRDKGLIIEDEDASVFIAFSDKHKSWFQEDFPNFVVHILPYETRNNLSVRISHVPYAEEMKNEMVALVNSYPHTQSCGGHTNAFGAAISDDAPKDDIFMLVEGLSTIAQDYYIANN